MVRSSLRLYSKIVAGSTFLLLLAGGAVTSTGSGLAVPDWPLSFGQWMPPMVGGIRYEHAHRLVAALVGSMIVIEAVWLWRADRRAWLKVLGGMAVAGVVIQGLLGGLTVLLALPDPVSISHAILAEIVFGLTVTIALACSRGWEETAGERTLDVRVPAFLTLAVATTILIFLQILLGAAVRHTGAGLAIPDFPLAYGQLVPPLGSRPVLLHFAHRVGALLVVLAVGWTALRAWRSHRGDPRLLVPALLLAALVALQIVLGAWTVLSYKAAWIATAHLGIGALLWATGLVLALMARRRVHSSPRAIRATVAPLLSPSR